MTINFTDFGLTSAIDPTDPTQVTADAQLRVSAQADSLGLIANYTQSTDTNKPLWSRSDNKENVFLNSGDLENASWSNFSLDRDSIGTVSGFNAFSLTELAATALHCLQVAASIPAASGQTCKILWRVKGNGRNFVRISRGGGAVAVTFGLTGAGTKLEATATGNITLQSDGYYLCEANIPLIGAITPYFELKTALTTGAESYAGDGTSGVLCYEPQFQFSAGADTTPLTTTDHPQYAGVNGRRWLVFNGAQGMNSTSLLSSIITADEEVMYMPIRPLVTSGVTQVLFRDTGGGNLLRINSNGIVGLYRNDGASKVAFSASGLSPNVSVIVRARHYAGFLTVGVDYGSGYIDGTPVACGSVGGLSNSFRIGYGATLTTDTFYGKLGGIFTANTGLAKPNFENLLREYYFARSQLIWDPYLAELVLKRPTVIG
jgi:hypothetical protein